MGYIVVFEMGEMKKDKEDIYSYLPIVMQNLITNWVGLKIKRERYNSLFWRLIREYEKRDTLSSEEIYYIRNKRMLSHLRYCFENVEFYKKSFSRRSILQIRERDLPEIVNYLPIIDKDIIKENFREFVAHGYPKRKLIWSHTSGTTGSGLIFPTTKEAICEQWAVWWKYRREHGIDFGTWCNIFGGRSVVPINQRKPPFWRYNIPCRQIYFSIYHMNPENLKYYYRKLTNGRAKWVHGYPSALNLISKHILEENLDPLFNIKWVTTGAENLLENHYNSIKNAFGVYPIQHYGLAEGVANISMCKRGNLHVDEEFAYVEFIPTEEKGKYRIIGTNLSNKAMAFIRYDTGDIATLDEVRCDCGKPGRVVRSIDGRKEDYVVLKDGRKIGRLDHIFKDLVNVKEAQIYQEKKGEVQFRIVKGNKYTFEDERKLIREATKRLGNETDIDIIYVSEIEKTGAGKKRFVISNVSIEE